MPRRREEPPCPNRAAHTDVHGHAEAVRMWRTHEQSRCPGCGLWVIWTPLPAGSLVECWWCNERNVDPAALAEGDEPLCVSCKAERAARFEADRQEWIAAEALRPWREAT